MSRGLAFLLILILAVSYLITVKSAFSFTSAAENTWAKKAPMNQARADLGVAVVNGKIYAIGGSVLDYQDQSRVESKEVGTNEEYDPTTNTWTYKKAMPTLSSLFAIAVYNDKIYCIGSGKNQVYNPADDTWENKAAMPNDRIKATANVVNGKIYVIGGYPNTTLTEVYDPATDTWTTKQPASTEPFGPSVVYNSKIYVLGGTKIYDPITDTWSSKTAIPKSFTTSGSQELSGVTTGFMAPIRIYVFPGGEQTNQVYDPENDSWTDGASTPTFRGGFAVAVVDDLIYVIGGVSISYEGRPLGAGGVVTYYSTVEQYTPFGYGTVQPIIDVTAPHNKNYRSSVISVNFTVNGAVDWMGYSLDGQQNVTIVGNSTVSNLKNGFHDLIVYANDTFGNMGASRNIAFTISKPEPFPIIIVATVSIVGVAIVGTGLLVYFKRRKGKP